MARAKKPIKPSFVTTFSVVSASAAAAAASLALFACGGKTNDYVTTNPPEPTTSCTNTTQPGDPCTNGEGSCVSNGRTLECSGSRWSTQSEVSVNPPPPPCEPFVCPTTPPTSGASCAVCLDGTLKSAECTYETTPDCPPVIARCNAKTATWDFLGSSCNPPPPLPDAGDDGDIDGG